MKSGGQIDGQMSFQSPAVWRYREVNTESFLGYVVNFLEPVDYI
jgi:hypothetical protein